MRQLAIRIAVIIAGWGLAAFGIFWAWLHWLNKAVPEKA